jgi:hypothetical protein
LNAKRRYASEGFETCRPNVQSAMTSTISPEKDLGGQTYSDSLRPLIFRDLRALCCQVLLGLGVFAVLLGSSGGLMYSAGISPVSVFRKVTREAISSSVSCLPS